MYNFTLSAFADEIDPSLSKQLEILKAHDISFLELRSIDGINISKFDLQYAKEVKKQLDDSGVKVSALGSPIGKIRMDEDFDAHLDVLKHLLELAGILDTNYIRIFSFYPPKGEEISGYRDKVLERMQKMVDTVKGTPVILLHENEKEIYGDTAKRCYDILSTIHSPKLRCTFDPANFIQCEQNVYPEAYDLLKDYIEYIHIKDALKADHSVVPAGLGDGNVQNLINQLKEDNYQGFLSLEPHLGNFSGFADLELGEVDQNKEKSDEFKFAVAANALKKLL